MGASIAGTWLVGSGCADIGNFYTKLVQAVLLYGQYSWVASHRSGMRWTTFAVG